MPPQFDCKDGRIQTGPAAQKSCCHRIADQKPAARLCKIFYYTITIIERWASTDESKPSQWRHRWVDGRCFFVGSDAHFEIAQGIVQRGLQIGRLFPLADDQCTRHLELPAGKFLGVRTGNNDRVTRDETFVSLRL